jgi:hypothetical protein
MYGGEEAWRWLKWLMILAFEYPIERQRRLRREQERRERHHRLDADLRTAARRSVKQRPHLRSADRSSWRRLPQQRGRAAIGHDVRSAAPMPRTVRDRSSSLSVGDS